MATMFVNTPVGETVNVRASASTSATIKFTLGRGTQVDAVYYNSAWHYITCSKGSSYVMSEFLSTTNPDGGGSSVIGDGINVGQTLQLTATNVSVRESAPSGTVLWMASSPETYVVKGKQTVSGYVWYQIQKTSLGWLRGDFVKLYSGGGGTTLPSDVIAGAKTGFADTNSGALGVWNNKNKGTKLIDVPRHGSFTFYKTTDSAWMYVIYGGKEGYSDANYVCEGTWYDPTSSSPYDVIRAWSKGYAKSTKHIKVSSYLAALDVWARKTNYGYPTNRNNAGHWSNDNPPSICCAYMPYLATGSLGYNNCPDQKSTNGGSLIGGTVASLGGNGMLWKGMELF